MDVRGRGKQDERVDELSGEAAAVHQAREVLARWEAELAAVTAELQSVRDRAGGEVLDDPDAAERLPRVIGDLTARVDIAERAIRAQRPRVVDAERAYLLSEADKLRPAVKRAEGALQRHHERTTELLRQLEEHEGRFVPESALIEERWSHRSTGRYVGGDDSYDLPKSAALEDVLASARRPVLLLEELAAGRDPMLHPDLRDCVPHQVFPACVWGPDALVPCPMYLRFSRAAAEAAAKTATASEAEQVDA